MAKISKRGSERYEKFIQAGLEIFLEKGYEDTSLTDIIEKSGGSLASIYKFFDNKEGLLEPYLNVDLIAFLPKLMRKLI
jgi:transcription regulator protein